ncbi:hypothetical protein CHH91_19275, partial [Virgibacillus sp. 7505]
MPMNLTVEEMQMELRSMTEVAMCFYQTITLWVVMAVLKLKPMPTRVQRTMSIFLGTFLGKTHVA